ncbi:hypothetical protein C8Q75DRAFT_782485 [Abortiporus biennis]|nr:hypothetical protein C8Q75DRAFT_782485 [Abortiporus biennis]
MSVLRALHKHSRSLSRTFPTTPSRVGTRSFHSPFAVLSSSPLESPPSSNSNVSPINLEKQMDYTLEPFHSSGANVYVVSEPDPLNSPYQVPSGAFPTSAPYVNYPTTEAPKQSPRSSTSSSFAHPYTTTHVPRNDSGVMESSAIRFSEAPGEMNARGGSHGGLGLMDEASTTQPVGELPNVNPSPDDPKVAEKFSSLGVDKAWKERK